MHCTAGSVPEKVLGTGQRIAMGSLPRFAFACVLASGLAAAGCGSPPASGARQETNARPSAKVVLTGSSTVAPLVAEIGRRFETENPTIRVDVQTGGSSRGIADAGTGVADLGMSSRILQPDEAAELREHAIAYDGVAFVVHASNPVTELSDEQLLEIYTGTVEEWSEVGGLPGPITVVNRAAGRSELELVTEYLGISASQIRADLISGENQHALKTIAGDPSAIVYMSLGAAEREASAGAPVRLLPLRGVPGTSDAVASGAFPLARPLLLLSKGEPLGAASDFLAFAGSPRVDDLIESLAYVPPRR